MSVSSAFRVTACAAALLTLLSSCSYETIQNGDEPLGTAGAPLGDPHDRVWLAPNVASQDMLQLFTEPDRWMEARKKLGVFQFYAQQLGADDAAGCAMCEQNVFPNFVANGAFDRLRDWNIGIAIESGAIKHHTCDGEVGALGLSGVIDKVESVGASVRYVAMDEPYAGGEQVVNGQSCHYGRDQSAAETARFIRKLQELHPTTQVGDVEPYPYFRVDQLEAWLDALAAQGITPAFFHLDVDRNYAKQIKVNVPADLQNLRAFCAARGIPFGVIFWGMEVEVPASASNKDQLYATSVSKWVQTVNGAIGAPDQAIFQSWFESPDHRRLVPVNLGENDWSHTRVLKDGANVFGYADVTGVTPSPSDPPPPPPPPSGGDVGSDPAAVKVAHAYKGVLGREADPGGLAAFTDALHHGMSTVDFCNALYESDEFKANRGGLDANALTVSLYEGILEREPDPGGAESTAQQIANGNRAGVSAAMLDSDEFAQRFLK